jgi:protein TonB
MFEQSVLPPVHTKRPFAFVLVTAAELILLAAAAAVPLFLIPPLIPPKLAIPFRFARAVTLVRADPQTTNPTVPVRRSLTVPAKFYAPARIPSHVAQAPDIGSISTPDVSFDFATGNATGVIGVLTEKKGSVPAAPPGPVPEHVSQAPVRVSQGVQEAKLINKVIPVYPRLAIQTRQFGKVHLIATIGKDGHIKELRVIDGPVFLVQAAVAAVKQWLYRPTLLSGQAVEVIAPIEINFTLSQ